VKLTAASVNGARRHSDADFLVMANQEFYGSPLGGHTNVLFFASGLLDARARVGSADDLTARGERPAAFAGRCIPTGCVAPRSHSPAMLAPRALPAGRLDAQK